MKKIKILGKYNFLRRMQIQKRIVFTSDDFKAFYKGVPIASER